MSSLNIEFLKSINIKLVSSDNIEFEVSLACVKNSKLLKTMLELDELDENEIRDQVDQQVCPLPNVEGTILKKVIEFLNKYLESPFEDINKPVKSSMSDIVDEWYVNFLEMDNQEQLFKIIMAANYMDIEPLLDLTCASVATIIKGKSPEEVRTIFNIDKKAV